MSFILFLITDGGGLAPIAPRDGVLFGFEGTEIASIFVAVIAAGAAYASQRAASKATRQSASDTSRTEIEKEAYVRAQQFLDGTIKRQDAELAEVRKEVDELREENRALRHSDREKGRKIHALEERLEAVSHENEELREANEVLQLRVTALTAEVHRDRPNGWSTD